MLPETIAQMGLHDSPVVQNAYGEQTAYSPGRILSLGRITHVDPERWTVNVDFEDTDQNQTDIPIMSPYFHQEIGQGAYFIPETGSRCVLMYCLNTWFIIGYLPTLDPKHIDFARSQKPVQSLSEEHVKFVAGETFPTGVSESRTVSFRNKRESDMVQGDYCIKTRGFNKSKWFATGNILHEASKLCYRLYSKLSDRIMDFATNYLLRTPGGDVTWTNDVESLESDYKREIRQRVSDQFTSYLELVGHDAKVYTRTVRHWEKIDGAGLDYLPQEGGRTYLPEHFYERIEEDGRWVRQVNYNFIEMHELSYGEPYTDKKSMYYELVEPTGEWDKRIEWRESGGTVTINFNEHVFPTGQWHRRISDVNGAYQYLHQIDPAGNQYEEVLGARTLRIHNDDTVWIKDNRATTIVLNDVLSIGADFNQTVGGAKTTTVTGDYHVNAARIFLNC